MSVWDGVNDAKARGAGDTSRFVGTGAPVLLRCCCGVLKARQCLF